MLGTYDFWSVESGRGFLPSIDPDHIKLRISALNSKSKALLDASSYLEMLASDIPYYMELGCAREELVAALRPVDISFTEEVPLAESEVLERLMMLYSYFGSFYVHSTGDNTAKRLPREIAVPLTELAKKLNRKPILSYANYCLTNWRRIDKDKPIELGNIELLQHFKNGVGEKDESWFILVHVDIENKAGPAIQKISEYTKSCCSENARDYLVKALEATSSSLDDMNITMNRMEEECSTDLYFDKVRPYIFGFTNVVYEGVDMKPVTHRGETGAQSSIIPAFIDFLGVVHKQSILTKHLDDMRYYMPYPHQNFLFNLKYKVTDQVSDVKEKNRVRNVVLNDPSLHDIYNKCVEGVVTFRKKHFEYAINYIQKKVANPQGTGGTPYIQWLGELIKETESYYVK